MENNIIQILAFASILIGGFIGYIAHKKNWNLPEIF